MPLARRAAESRLRKLAKQARSRRTGAPAVAGESFNPRHDLYPIPVPEAMLRDNTLSMGARLTGALIATYINSKTGEAWPTRETLASILGVEVKTVSRYTKELAKTGYLEVKQSKAGGRQNFSSNRYRFPFREEYNAKLRASSTLRSGGTSVSHGPESSVGHLAGVRKPGCPTDVSQPK